MYQIPCQSVQSVETFDSFPRHLNLWPITPPPPNNAPWGIVWRFVFSLCPFPDESADVNQSWCQSDSRFTASPDFWMLTPYNPQVPPCVSNGNVFGVYPFPDESAYVCQIWCQLVQPFDSFNILLNLCPPITSKMPHGILRGELYLAYVHSKMNPQTCTKFGANRSSCLTASPDFWICNPLNPPGVLRGELYLAYVDSQTSPQICTIWCQSVQPFDSFHKHFYVWSTNPPPSKCPWGNEGRLGFSLCSFPDESEDVNQSWCQSVQPFDSFPRLLNVWPPPPVPPLVSRGEICLAYIHSQMDLQMCSTCVPHLVSIGPAVWKLPQTFDFVTP